MTIKKNIVANFVGQGWRALMSFAFVPLYVRYLGIEAFGLIGIFTMLQAWLGLLDMGLRPTLSREMARFTGGAMDATGIHDVLRTVEVVILVLSAAAALAVWLASGWLAAEWVNAEQLSLDSVTTAFAMMGLVIALRFAEGMYLGCLTGMQRQVAENAVTVATSTARSLGAVLVLAFVSPTIEAFFIWQGLVSLGSIVALAIIVYGLLPKGARPARPSWATIQSIWRFAAGMMTITLMSLLTGQIDKILLSHALSLKAFGYYAIAAAVAAVVGTLAAPVTAAFGPRLMQLVTLQNDAAIRAAYHTAAQFVTVLAGTAAAMFVAFGDQILFLWTRDITLSNEVAPLLRILACGAFLQSVMNAPYFAQLAYGWTSLAVSINVATLFLVVPTLLWAIPRYGAYGAAWTWVGVTIIYLFASIILMHRRILRGEMLHWYLADLAGPVLAASVVALACAIAFPHGASPIASGAILTASLLLILAASVFAASEVRTRAFGLLAQVFAQRPRMPT